MKQSPMMQGFGVRGIGGRDGVRGQGLVEFGDEGVVGEYLKENEKLYY